MLVVVFLENEAFVIADRFRGVDPVFFLQKDIEKQTSIHMETEKERKEDVEELKVSLQLYASIQL